MLNVLTVQPFMMLVLGLRTASVLTFAQISGRATCSSDWTLFVEQKLPERTRLLQYLELELPFSEADLIQENKEYLQRTLKLDTLEVKVSDGSVVPNAAGKGQDKAVPGQPVVVLLKQ